MRPASAGIFRFRAGESEGELVAPDNRHLVADLEGLALVPEGNNGSRPFASSQGDNTYMEAMRGDFGPDFPGGLFVAQDGQNGRGAACS